MSLQSGVKVLTPGSPVGSVGTVNDSSLTIVSRENTKCSMFIQKLWSCKPWVSANSIIENSILKSQDFVLPCTDQFLFGCSVQGEGNKGSADLKLHPGNILFSENADLKPHTGYTLFSETTCRIQRRTQTQFPPTWEVAHSFSPPPVCQTSLL